MPSSRRDAAPPLDDFRPLALLVGAAMFMEQLDATIISPVIPQMARQFEVAPLDLNLAMTIYLLCSLVFLPISGVLAARWSSRRLFCASLLLFVASSALCALAAGPLSLYVWRAVQGVAAAMMVPVGRNVLIHAVSRDKLVQALAWMVTPAMLGPMFGPPIGGFIGTHLSWHWVFWMNVPVGLVGLWAAWRLMPRLHTPPGGDFALREWLLLAALLILAVIGVEYLRQPRPSAWTLAYAAAMLALLAAYGRCRRHLRRPMLDFSLLRVRSFAAGFWGGSLIRVGYGTLPFLLPIMLQSDLGYSPLESGCVLLAGGMASLLAKPRTPSMLSRWGFRHTLIGNGWICAAGLAVCACYALPGWNIVSIAATMAVFGCFRAIQFNVLTAIAYADLPAEKVASATTLNTMAWQLAVMLGISVSTVIVEAAAALRGRAMPLSADYAAAFAVMALICLVALPCYRALSMNAGAELSGHSVKAV